MMAGERGDERRMLRDFVTPCVQGIVTSIARPHVEANNFELKSALISMVQQSQFGGILLEDPNLHLDIFRGVQHLEAQLSFYQCYSIAAISLSLRDKVRA